MSGFINRSQSQHTQEFYIHTFLQHTIYAVHLLHTKTSRQVVVLQLRNVLNPAKRKPDPQDLDYSEFHKEVAVL